VLGLRKSKRRPRIYCDAGSRNARSVFSDLEADLVDSRDKADLLWLRHGGESARLRLKPYQLLNHLPGEEAMVDKGRLTEALGQYESSPTDGEPPPSSFYPETYRLYDRDECERFFAQLPEQDSQESPWILKPTDLSSGRGVLALWELDRLRRAFQNPDHGHFDPGIDSTRDYIVQRYIRDPLLLRGRKSEIRVYWLVASLDPLLVLLYREGTVRLNSLPFRLDDFSNPLVHVTNVYQQKRHRGYDPTLRLKWDFEELEKYVTCDLGVADPGFLQSQLLPQVRSALGCVVRAALGERTAPAGRGLCFGLYGADLILDSSLRLWLTEIQKGPGLSLDDPIKQRVIPAMLQEVLRIVLEVQARKRQGSPLTSLATHKGSEWVIDAS